MSFCVEEAVAAVGGRAGARAGRHHPLQLALRHRLPPSGLRGGDAGLPRPGRARRLHDDQGPLARHRRQGPVLDRHRRRVPGGDDLPRRASSTAAASWSATSTGSSLANSRVPKMVAGDINAEVAGVRTGAASLLRADRALRRGAFPELRSRACTTTARRSCAAASTRHSRRPLRRCRGGWTTTESTTIRSRSRSTVEVAARL